VLGGDELEEAAQVGGTNFIRIARVLDQATNVRKTQPAISSTEHRCSKSWMRNGALNHPNN